VLRERAGDIGSKGAVAEGREGDEEVDEPDAACCQLSLVRLLSSILHDVGDDQIPLGPDVSGGLDSLNTALGSGVDLVQLLIVTARHAVDGSGCAQLLVWASLVHAGVAVDGSRHVGDIFGVGGSVASRTRGQGIGGQALEGEAHLECRQDRATRCGSRREGDGWERLIDKIRKAERAADSYTVLVTTCRVSSCWARSSAVSVGCNVARAVAFWQQHRVFWFLRPREERAAPTATYSPQPTLTSALSARHVLLQPALKPGLSSSKLGPEV
jgi:hypothetical protein